MQTKGTALLCDLLIGQRYDLAEKESRQIRRCRPFVVRMRYHKQDVHFIACISLENRRRRLGQGDPWDGEIKVGLTASKYLIEGFADHFASAGDRAIGVVSSVYAQFVGGSQPVGYHVVKAGLNEMVRYYAATLGRRGVRVNAIMPLTYMKDESRHFYEENAALMDVYERLVPLRRMGHAEDSANALNFLCSEQASFINGQSLFIDGGVSIVWPEEVAKSFARL